MRKYTDQERFYNAIEKAFPEAIMCRAENIDYDFACQIVLFYKDIKFIFKRLDYANSYTERYRFIGIDFLTGRHDKHLYSKKRKDIIAQVREKYIK